MDKRLLFTVGKDTEGNNIIADVNKVSNILIAGSTGSGKTVFISSVIMSILSASDPDDVQLIIVDTSSFDLDIFSDIPHLYSPIINNPESAINVLNRMVEEMNERNRKFDELGVKNISEYNKKIQSIPYRKNKKMPRIVIIIDDFSDVMKTAPHAFEKVIYSLTGSSMAGIHLIIATQRASDDVITGVIKQSIHSRIAFAVTDKADSMVILDCPGAEKLMGMGDMLYKPQGVNKPLRVQGVFVDEDEMERVVMRMKKDVRS